MAQPNPRGPRGPLGWIFLYSRGLIYDQHMRRLTMFYAVLAALIMAFCGDVFFADWLGMTEQHGFPSREHAIRFAVYWIVCGWLTILAALLAIYDLLLLRIQHRLARRELRERMVHREHDEDDHG